MKYRDELETVVKRCTDVGLNGLDMSSGWITPNYQQNISARYKK